MGLGLGLGLGGDDLGLEGGARARARARVSEDLGLGRREAVCLLQRGREGGFQSQGTVGGAQVMELLRAFRW